MTSTMFVDDDAKSRMATWFETFRSTLPFPTETRLVDTPEGRTHVLVAGPEHAPPLVCLHGALATSAHLLPELGSLVESHRIYAIDVVGQSVMSADHRIDVRTDAYGHWLAVVCRALGLSKISLFGVSWGGFVALRAAKVAPDLVHALVLLVPAGVVAGSAWTGFTTVGWRLFMYRFAPSPKRLRRLVDAMFTTYDEQWSKWFGDAVLSYRMDMRIPPLATPEELADFTSRGRPTLVLGAADDVSFPGSALIARARELVPHAEVVLLEACKHCPPFDDAFRASTSRRVQAFLEQAQGTTHLQRTG